MPKIVDHDERRREITDAVCRITLRGGLARATFRHVATEAGTSSRLVQYYFGTKAELLETTRRHVGDRSIARLKAWIEATDGSPRAVLGAFLKSFIPSDEESRVAMLMYVALADQTLIAADRPDLRDGAAKPATETQMMHAMIVEQLERASLAPGVDPRVEATAITAMIPGLGQYVLDGSLPVAAAFATIDYQLDRAFGGVPADALATNGAPT